MTGNAVVQTDAGHASRIVRGVGLLRPYGCHDPAERKERKGAQAAAQREKVCGWNLDSGPPVVGPRHHVRVEPHRLRGRDECGAGIVGPRIRGAICMPRRAAYLFIPSESLLHLGKHQQARLDGLEHLEVEL